MQSYNQKEINRRRTFGIISHPDGGKTTLTEKLLLFGGAIHSDLARGFIRAKCFSCDDLIALGSEKQVGEKGLMAWKAETMSFRMTTF